MAGQTAAEYPEDEHLPSVLDGLARRAENLARTTRDGLYELLELRTAYDDLDDVLHTLADDLDDEMPLPVAEAADRLSRAQQELGRRRDAMTSSDAVRRQALNYGIRRVGASAAAQGRRQALIALDMRHYDPGRGPEIMLLIDHHLRLSRYVDNTTRRVVLEGPEWLGELLDNASGFQLAGVAAGLDPAVAETAARLWFDDLQNLYPTLEAAIEPASLLAA